MRRRLRYRFGISRSKRFLYLSTGFAVIAFHCLWLTFLFWSSTPTPVYSRLHADLPLTFDLTSYSVCHPDDHDAGNISAQYHERFKRPTCFLIEHLDGGPWWSYVTHEFAEILTTLKEIGEQFKVKYRTFNQLNDTDDRIDLVDYIRRACHIDERNYERDPIVILIWDINQVRWHTVAEQWQRAFRVLNIRLLAFIDDLHYPEKDQYHSRQYLFQSLASEIFSTYAYLFHNYYLNISAAKLTWMPHAASRLSFHSINQTAVSRLFVSGLNNPEWYPCRARAYGLCRPGKHLATCLKHPGYGVTMHNDSEHFYGGQRYFTFMRQFAFGLGTCQSVHYAIAKLFELPANGVALVTTGDLVPVLERLHLFENEHFLTVDCSATYRLREEVSRLQNLSRSVVDDVRRKSQEVVYERHMIDHRAQLLHVRLLAQALAASASTDRERRRWDRWGRSCA